MNLDEVQVKLLNRREPGPPRRWSRPAVPAAAGGGAGAPCLRFGSNDTARGLDPGPLAR